MPEADGSIIIDTEIDDSGVRVGTKEIEESAKRMANSVTNVGEKARAAIQKQVDSIVKLNNQFQQQSRKVDELKQKLQEYGKAQVPTDGYKALTNQIEELENKFMEVEAKQREWLSMGFPMDSAPLEAVDKELDEIYADIERLETKQKEMKANGSAYEDPTQSQGYLSTFEKLNTEEKKLSQMNDRVKESFRGLKEKMNMEPEGSKTVSLASRLKKALSGIGKVASQAASALGRMAGKAIVSGIKRLSKALNDTNRKAAGTGISLKKVLGYAIGIEGLYSLFSKMRSAASEGLQTLAQYSGTTNANLSALKSSLYTLRNALTAAFSPIINVVAPILTKFINMLTTAANYVSMFFAALTGKSAYTKAIAVQESYAGALEDTAGAASDAAGATEEAAKAAEDYLSPLDDINKFQTQSNGGSGGSSGGSGGSGGAGGSTGPMFTEEAINSGVADLVNQLKDLIEKQDWGGLGKLIADNINSGLKTLYNVLNWKKVGKKITKFVDAFTDAFNSLVDHIDWDLMGRTIGTGINTLVKTLNRLIERIDWKNLGKKFAKGVNGLLNEVNWRELGNLIGNKFMIAWDIFSGFVEDLDWAELGVSIAEGLNGIFEKIDFGSIGDTLATGINGAFTTLLNFTQAFDWSDFASNVGSGISNFLTGINWEENGQALGKFITDLCGAIRDLMTVQNFYEIGNGIGTFLSQLPWEDMLYTAGVTLVNAFGGVLSGLASTPAGAFVAAFIVIIKGNELIDKLSGAFKTLFNTTVSKGASDAAETIGSSAGILKLKKALGIITAGWFAAEATMVKLSSSDVTKSVSESADTVADALDKIAIQSQLTEGQVGNLKTMLENSAESNENTLSTYSNLAIELHNMGVKSEDVRTILEDLGVTVSDDAMVIANRMKDIEDGIWRIDGTVSSASDSIKQSNDEVAQSSTDTMNSVNNSNFQIGQSASDAASRIDEAKGLWIKGLDGWKQVTGDKAIEIYNAIQNGLYYQNSEGYYVSGSGAMISFGEGISSEIGNIQTTAGEIGESVAKSTSASYSTKLNALRQPTSEITKSFVNEGVKSPAESELGISGNKSSVFEGYGETVPKSLSKGADSQKSTVWNKMSDIFKGVTGSFSNLEKDMESKGKKAVSSLSGGIGNNSRIAVNQMQLLLNKMNSTFANLSGTYQRFGGELSNGLSKGISSSNSVNVIMNAIQSMINKLNSIGRMMYSVGQNIAQNLANGIKSVHIPVPTISTSGSKRYSIGNSSFSVPNFKVSYLASGAVIPPNQEFLAVLGDQKRGNNIEAPEGLLRKIVREESGETNGNVSKLTFVGQINGRTLFEEVISEAKLRQMVSGKNPFELR